MATFDRASICPYCGYVMDSATEVIENSGHAPSKGALALCFKCCEYSMYDDGVMLVPLDEEAKSYVETTPETIMLREKLLLMHAQRSKQ